MNSSSGAPAIPPDRATFWRSCMRRIAANDASALTVLYDQSSRVVYGLALRILGSEADAEEVTLDVYAQVWRTAAGYQESRGSVMSWLATIARTRAIDRLRSRASAFRSEQSLSEAGDLADSADSEAAAATRLEIGKASEALRRLPEEQRRAVSLAYFSGMTHSEISAHLAVPIGTVKTRIRLGMMRLRELMENRA